MICFIKLKKCSKTYADFLLKHPLLKWEASFDEDSNDIVVNEQEVFIKKRKAIYKGLIFKIRYNEQYSDPLIFIEGSIHKFKNGGKHNYDDFPIKDLLKTVLCICSEFQINCNDVIVQSSEIGFNIDLGYWPDYSLFQRFIVFHGYGGSKQPSPIDREERKGWGKGIIIKPSDDYHLKFYIKDNGLLRVELHIDRTQVLKENHQLRDLKISTLIDYCKVSNIKQIYEELLFAKIDDIFIDEGVQEDSNISSADIKFYNEHLRYVKWLELNSNEKKSAKKKIEKILKYHQCYSIKDMIKEKLIEKMNESFKMDEEDFLLIKKLESSKFLLSNKIVKSEEITSDYHSIECNLELNDILSNNIKPLNKLSEADILTDEIKEEYVIDLSQYLNISYFMELNYEAYLTGFKKLLYSFNGKTKLKNYVALKAFKSKKKENLRTLAVWRLQD